jgi:hypothetical protein
MHRAIKYRVLCIASLWKHRAFSWWCIPISILYTIFTIWRDEFASPEQQEHWRAIKMLPHWPISWWIAISLGAIIIWLFESSFRLAGGVPPLEIIFDPNNPSMLFWSMESPEYENGKPKSMPYWEYRVEIKNNSTKTLRNVSLTTAFIGPMPQRPADQPFDKIKKPSCDIKPWCSELVPVIRWPIPEIQPGMLIGEDYGPIKVTASADDTKPSIRIFKFDYQRTPMLFD